MWALSTKVETVLDLVVVVIVLEVSVVNEVVYVKMVLLWEVMIEIRDPVLTVVRALEITWVGTGAVVIVVVYCEMIEVLSNVVIAKSIAVLMESSDKVS